MKVIYQPKARSPAGEYCPLAIRGPYVGCLHGCRYCFNLDYCQQAWGISSADFHHQPYPRANFIRDLAADVAAVARNPRLSRLPILISFTTDPCQPLETELGLTRGGVELLAGHGLTPVILTKAGLAAKPVLGPLQGAPGAWFGQTLTFMSPGLSRLWEPKSAVPADRLGAARLAKSMGILTWASLEPVVHPSESLAILQAAAPHLDHVAVGTLNHWTLGEVRAIDPSAKAVDWATFLQAAMAMLEMQGFQRSAGNLTEPGKKTYYIKQDLIKKAGF
jgi:DNA repair photolyase